ncbi:MAG: 16S rRNA (cytosine(1402)-N(4))-methyltransferase RsmH [Rickettsiales bacterium]|nr:16S rRNA (cytosine(1402)-N(4))-methyltransferase RsmH [Rickettsiales bacterium]
MQNEKILGHSPVMLEEVLAILAPGDGELLLDATFGAGGYTKALLDANDSCRVVALDRDENVREFARDVKNTYGDRFEFHNILFSEASSLLGGGSLAGLVLDLGVSSMQLEDGRRGFSFAREASLLMTMGKNSLTAYDVVNGFGEEELASLIYSYGEEPRSRVIARRIVSRRKLKTLETTLELATLVRGCFRGRGKIDNATRVFQAIRIFVNDELEELRKILRDSLDLLGKGGRLVAVSFNSLEDRIVKRFFTENGNLRPRKNNKYGPSPRESEVVANFSVPLRKPLLPSEAEVRRNPRARSAKLRWGLRC